MWEQWIENPEKIYFEKEEQVTPYIEVVEQKKKYTPNGQSCVKYNAMYRYFDIFYPLFAEPEEYEDRLQIKDENTKKYIFDIMIHLLLRLEKRKEANLEECKIQKIRWELEEGDYGEKIGTWYRKLDRTKQYTVAKYLRQQEQTKESITIFARAITEILGDGVVYNNQSDKEELLFYLGRKELIQDEKNIECIKELFLPFGRRVRVMYENCFMLIGQENEWDSNYIMI